MRMIRSVADIASKLTGGVDPAHVVEYAPGQLETLKHQ